MNVFSFEVTKGGAVGKVVYCCTVVPVKPHGSFLLSIVMWAWWRQGRIPWQSMLCGKSSTGSELHLLFPDSSSLVWELLQRSVFFSWTITLSSASTKQVNPEKLSTGLIVITSIHRPHWVCVWLCRRGQLPDPLQNTEGMFFHLFTNCTHESKSSKTGVIISDVVWFTELKHVGTRPSGEVLILRFSSVELCLSSSGFFNHFSRQI